MTGEFHADRTVAVTGSEAEDRKYHSIKIGANSTDLVGQVSDDVRLISGDVLTGDKLSNNQYIGFYHTSLTLIPEGNKHRILGWMPFFIIIFIPIPEHLYPGYFPIKDTNSTPI